MSVRRSLAIALTAAAVLALSACAATPSEDGGTGTKEASGDGFPRTVEVPAGTETEATDLKIDAEPEKIAALDYESAETVAELGLADRLVLVPEAVTNPALGSHVDEMKKVPATIPVAMDLDAETVIAASPDLVLMSPRHGAESKIGTVLTESGITTLQLPDSWTDVDHLIGNIDLIGQATGAEKPAEKLTTTLEKGLEPSGDSEEGPRVLVLTNQAGRPFITAGQAFPLQLLELAGARSVSDDLGIKVTGTISAEQIVEADPDGILLIDMNGTENRMFAELLSNPAVAALPGAEQTLMLQGKEVQALGLEHTVDGLDQLKTWVKGLEA